VQRASSTPARASRAAASRAGSTSNQKRISPSGRAAAREALAGVELARCTAAGQCLDHEPTVVLGGNGITGPVFMDNAAFRDYAFATFDADALDMETGAVAHVAHAHGVPYIAFRSLSDLAGGDHGANGVMTFLDLAAGNAATVVRAFLRGLP
jgi:adenosylhomocysteine nucleosidase